LRGDHFSARCFAAQQGRHGSSNAAHAFRPQASDAITVEDQLLTRSSTGSANAFTPLLNSAIRCYPSFPR